jgi:replicative DNA helicase Mcm
MEQSSLVENDSENPFVPKFEAFFKSRYKKDIEILVGSYPEKRSLNVDFKELEHFDIELADELLVNPDYLLEAAKQAIQNIDVPALEVDEFTPHIRFFNLPKDCEPLLRDIQAQHLGKLIAIEGVIRQITDVLPKLKVALWECRRCGNTYRINQDKTQLIKQPNICECKHKDFSLVAEQSEFEDYQKIQIQEPLEKLRGNEQPTTLDIYVADDLVNKVTAGDKTRFVGMLRLLQPKDRKVVYGRYLEAAHLEETEKEFLEVEVSKEDEEIIKELASNPKVYDMLIGSIAPGIYGHEIVKEAIVLQLFGGVKKLLPDNSQIRGNIHMLLVGDPGLAKSQLLKASDRIAPKSIYVAGKTTSGVGLTASAVKDDFGEGGWTLKAGALVLSSGGMAMIDEFDKMVEEDRSAMHEAMEQGRVSIAKAGIVTSFKTDTSILAAANPKYGRFDPYEPFLKQINLPPTLISRFDLFFPMKDVLDRTKDSEIAGHILKTHQAGEMLLQQAAGQRKISKKETEQLEKMVLPLIDGELLKKYISFARQNIYPVMSPDTMKLISTFYLDLRESGRKDGSYAATHRQLEGVVRLCEASARVRLTNNIEVQDVERAIRLITKSLEELALDKETGKIDIDLITSGQSHTQLNKMKKILSLVKEINLDTGQPVPLDQLLEKAAGENIKEDEVREHVATLKKKGDLYEPKHGFLKPA